MPNQFVLTREQFDRLQFKLVQLLLGCPAEMAPAAIAHSYPVQTSVAIDECRKRGVQANAYQMAQFLKRHPDLVPVVGGTRLWSRAAIDLWIEELVDRKLLMDQTLDREASGKTAEATVVEMEATFDAQLQSEDSAAQRVAEHTRGQLETYASN